MLLKEVGSGLSILGFASSSDLHLKASLWRLCEKQVGKGGQLGRVGILRAGDDWAETTVDG